MYFTNSYVRSIKYVPQSTTEAKCCGTVELKDWGCLNTLYLQNNPALIHITYFLDVFSAFYFAVFLFITYILI